jgi:hypothetical protein
MGETLSLTQSEELRLRVSENRALRRTLGPKRKEVAGGTFHQILLGLSNK